MNANHQRVGVLLEQTIRLKAPLFQRPYVWTEKNWEPLWDSITDVAQRLVEQRPLRAHFLGAIVLEQEFVAPGQIGDVRLIIDGQQRLTTLQILLAVLRDISVSASLDFEADTFDRLISNHTQNDKERAKVVPTTDDRGPYTRVMTAGSIKNMRKLFGDTREVPLARCYEFMHNRAMAWLADGGLQHRLQVLATVINQYLVLVAINLDGKDDDAQEIFETLNTRGEPLEPGDLVKNFLLRAAEANQTIDEDGLKELHEHYWREFDGISWRRKVRQGRLFAPRMTAFLQHYVTLRKKDEVLSANVFAAFRSVADTHAIEQEFASLRSYAAAYQAISDPSPDADEFRYLTRIKQLDITTFHPLLMETWKRRADDAIAADEAHQIFADIDSYLVRREVCGLPTNAYNRLVVDAIKALSEHWSSEALREFLLGQTSPTRAWPTDEDFKSCWITAQLYKGRRARVVVILEALEHATRDDRMENIQIPKLTIEHLLPQKWEAHWPTSDLATVRLRGRLLHTIGNLTLLTKVLNPEISNGPWPKKIAKILEHSALALNRQLPEAQWDEAAIEARADRLFLYAVGVWPRPPDARAAGAVGAPDPADTRAEIGGGEPLSSAHRDVLGRIESNCGIDVSQAVESVAIRLQDHGVTIRAGKSSLRGRLRVTGHAQRLSLFFIDTDGRVKFGWMRSGQLEELGLPEDFADDYYAKLAAAYDVALKDHIPDKLHAEMVASNPDTFIEIVLEFVEKVRAAAGDIGDEDDEEEVEPG